MLPLRSRTSWRLRALTVACLPRDWTRAGVYHFANNRRRGHDLPEGHHGELVEQVRATRHTRRSFGLADPEPFKSGRTLGRGRHCHVAGPAQPDSCGARHGHHPGQLRQQRSRQHHPRQRIPNRYQLQPGKSDPAPDNTLATASVLGQAGLACLQALQEPESPPWGNSSSRHMRPQMLAARPRAGAEWPRQRTTRMVRPIVPGAFSMAQNAHFGDSIGHRDIRRATDHIGGYRTQCAC
jgi:hypothetical protein